MYWRSILHVMAHCSADCTYNETELQPHPPHLSIFSSTILFFSQLSIQSRPSRINPGFLFFVVNADLCYLCPYSVWASKSYILTAPKRGWSNTLHVLNIKTSVKSYNECRRGSTQTLALNFCQCLHTERNVWLARVHFHLVCFNSTFKQSVDANIWDELTASITHFPLVYFSVPRLSVQEKTKNISQEAASLSSAWGRI